MTIDSFRRSQPAQIWGWNKQQRSQRCHL